MGDIVGSSGLGEPKADNIMCHWDGMLHHTSLPCDNLSPRDSVCPI
jgi:hypothetical protein